jgi:hypothetical protein
MATDVGFHIVLRHREGERAISDLASESAKREAFWEPLKQFRASSFASDWTDEQVENTFVALLKRTLRESYYALIQLRSPTDVDPEKSARTRFTGEDSPGVIFLVQRLEYGSLDVFVAVEPLKKLVELFDHNFEYFQLALASFVPEAVNSALYNTFHFPAVRDLLDISIVPSPGLVAAFGPAAPVGNAPPPPPSPTGTVVLTTAAKANWIWIAANTSLLVPTLLAVGYLFVMREDIREGERLRAEQSRRVVSEQSNLIATCGALLKEALPYKPPVEAPLATKTTPPAPPK